MKKLLLLLITLPLFLACSSEDDNGQDYTSFIVTIDAAPTFPNCVAGYKQTDGTFKKIASLGDLTKGKYSSEVKIDYNIITEIYLFTDYNNVVRFDAVYQLKKNTKNTITVANGTGGISITDKTDPTQYPQ